MKTEDENMTTKMMIQKEREKQRQQPSKNTDKNKQKSPPPATTAQVKASGNNKLISLSLLQLLSNDYYIFIPRARFRMREIAFS